jgi:hypothetical protein
MGWGALRRRLWPPQARESGGALVWGPALQAAGRAGARWTWAGAVEWGCKDGVTGCELGRSHVSTMCCLGPTWGAVAGGSQEPSRAQPYPDSAPQGLLTPHRLPCCSPCCSSSMNAGSSPKGLHGTLQTQWVHPDIYLINPVSHSHHLLCHC